MNATPSLRRFLNQSAAIANAAQPIVVRGRLTRVAGLVMEAVGLKLPLGSQVLVVQDESLRVDAEVVGFSGERLFLMPTSEPVGLRPGALVVPHEAIAPVPRVAHDNHPRRRVEDRARHLPMGEQLLGRVLDHAMAVGLLHGDLTAEHYEDAAADPRIDALRAKMVVVEEPRYTADYLDPSRRSIANAVQVFFRDRTATERVEVEYPIGHPRRRREGLPLLEAKLAANLGTRFAPARARRLLELCLDHERFSATPVPLFMELLAD